MRGVVICAVMDGDPPFHFTWYKDGQVLQENSQLSFKSHEVMSTLVISNLGPESNGNYSCVATNDGGRDEKFDILRMKGEGHVK